MRGHILEAYCALAKADVELEFYSEMIHDKNISQVLKRDRVDKIRGKIKELQKELYKIGVEE